MSLGAQQGKVLLHVLAPVLPNIPSKYHGLQSFTSAFKFCEFLGIPCLCWVQLFVWLVF